MPSTDGNGRRCRLRSASDTPPPSPEFGVGRPTRPPTHEKECFGSAARLPGTRSAPEKGMNRDDRQGRTAAAAGGYPGKGMKGKVRQPAARPHRPAVRGARCGGGPRLRARRARSGEAARGACRGCLPTKGKVNEGKGRYRYRPAPSRRPPASPDASRAPSLSDPGGGAAPRRMRRGGGITI